MTDGRQDGTSIQDRLRLRLRNGQVPLGTIVASSRGPDVVRMLAALGYDFVWIDMQHSTLSFETVGDHCAMARACGLTPIVRPASRTRHAVRRLIDAGALGIVYYDVDDLGDLASYASWVNGAAEAAIRSDFSLDERIGAADVMLIAQVESERAIEVLPELVATGMIDLLQVGRYDLAESLGVSRRPGHPAVLEAVTRIVEIATASAVPVAAGAYSPDDALALLDRGVRCLHYHSDITLLSSAYRDAMGWLRDPKRRVDTSEGSDRLASPRPM